MLKMDLQFYQEVWFRDDIQFISGGCAFEKLGDCLKYELESFNLWSKVYGVYCKKRINQNVIKTA